QRLYQREIAMDRLFTNNHVHTLAGRTYPLLKVDIKLLGNIARQLQMLLLIVADRNVRRTVDKNIGSHQTWIGEQAERGVFTILAGLVLELRHAVHPADARDAVEHPGKFGVLWHRRLIEDNVLDRINARSNECRSNRAY